MNAKQICLCLGAAVVAIGGWSLAQQPSFAQPDRNDLGIAMRAKLASSNRIIEGLTCGNYDLVRKGAEELRDICDSRVWMPREDQVYTHYRSELHRSAMKLVDMSQQENLDGAAYTYMHVLTTCINCHQYSRDTLRIAEIPDQHSAVVPIPTTDSTHDLRNNRSLRLR